MTARPAWERVLRFVAAMSALCAAAAFPASAAFDLETVDVRGNTAVPAADVLGLIGIAPRDSAFRVNAFQIRDRLRADPRIEDGWSSLAFPHHLTVYVRERGPVAALRAGNGFVLLARDAVVIRRAPSRGPYLLLRVDRLDASQVQLGAPVPSSDVRLAASLADGLPSALRGEVAGLRVDAGGEVLLQIRDGTTVLVGGPEGIRDRLGQVPDILAAVRARGMRVRYVDLRFPGSVIVKPASAGPEAGAGLPARPAQQEKP